MRVVGEDVCYASAIASQPGLLLRPLTTGLGGWRKR